LQAEADALSGKDHQKARGEKGKKISALRSGGRYIDACRVTKGLAPAHGHFEAESADTAGAEEIVDPQSAARLAAEATAALRRVEGAAPRGKSVGGGAGNSGSTADAEVEELREEERRLLARLAARGTAGLPPSAAKEVERLSAEIAELKAGLAAEGLTEGEQDKEERVLPRLVRLAELQQSQRHDKKQERRDREELEGIRGEVELLRAKVDAHKRGLREEGLTSKEVRQDAQVGDLEERLATLRRMGGA